MVWKISKKNEGNRERHTADRTIWSLNDSPLAFLAWAIEHLQYIG